MIFGYFKESFYLDFDQGQREFQNMWIVDFGVLFNFSGESWVVVQKVAD